MHGVEERASVYCPAQGQGCGGDALDTSPDMAQEGLETPQRNKIPAQSILTRHKFVVCGFLCFVCLVLFVLVLCVHFLCCF